MNATLWVIWVSLLTLFGALGITIGGRYFVSEDLLSDTWRDGYEQGCDDELASCAPCDCPHAATPPWDDTADALTQRAAPYYEPLARGAGPTVPVTTAPCPGEGVPLKGDSPGPGSIEFMFVPANPGPFPSPIFDELAAERAALDLRPPLAPPAGDGASPPAPPVHALSGEQVQAGAGADVWDRIAAQLDEDPQLNEWAIRAEVDRCGQIRRELQQLARTLEAT